MRRSISRLRTLGHGFRTKPRSALVFVLRLALGAPWLGVVGILHEPTGIGMGVSVGFWCRLAAVVHAPALGVFLLEFVLWGSGLRLRALGWVLWDRLSELILFGLGSGCGVLESLGGGGCGDGFVFLRFVISVF
ncbi:hypothetical protein AJGP001_13585 [Planococcus faecalis]|uniref:Transmembrane protein n=1 Tax=Planococcus faecalis TaxID=1598147 RepID=A0ABN4XNA0_9BACL|nr:hypothetical protein AJGP001_13585 [Planococcus faecalis]